MELEKLKAFIAGKVEEGLSLSRIQDELNKMGEKMTFMELRLIASEIESGVWKKQEAAAAPKNTEPAPAAAAPANDDVSGSEEDSAGEDGVPPYLRSPQAEMNAAAPAEAPEKSAESADPNKPLRGKTTVSLSPIQRPGFLAGGSVKFGSGASADWFLDQTGRLALDNLVGGEPDQQDIAEFRVELQRALGA